MPLDIQRQKHVIRMKNIGSRFPPHLIPQLDIVPHPDVLPIATRIPPAGQAAQQFGSQLGLSDRIGSQRRLSKGIGSVVNLKAAPSVGHYGVGWLQQGKVLF